MALERRSKPSTGVNIRLTAKARGLGLSGQFDALERAITIALHRLRTACPVAALGVPQLAAQRFSANCWTEPGQGVYSTGLTICYHTARCQEHPGDPPQPQPVSQRQ